jgi:hypothetical protein
LARNTLHVLIPRSELWEKPFAEWSENDWRWCGYSAQWDLTTGQMRWAVGGVARAEMKEKGLPLPEFLKSEQLAEYRRVCPELFKEGPRE